MSVIMLPAEKATDCLGLIKCIKDRKAMFPEDDCKIGDIGFGVNISEGVKEYWQKQHLYLISDEEIKECDWYYYNYNIFKCNSKQERDDCHRMKLKRVAATTDEYLHIKTGVGATTIEELRDVPKIPESFIKAYIKAYNEDKIITEVDLEIEEYDECILNKGFDYKSKIKTREDGTVIIHQSKTYIKAEIIELMFASMNKGYTLGHIDTVNGNDKSDLEVRDYFENWIAKNDKNF